MVRRKRRPRKMRRKSRLRLTSHHFRTHRVVCPCQTQPCHREAGILVDGGLEEAGSLAEGLSATGIQSLHSPQIKVVCLRIQTPWLVVYHAGMYIIVENRSVRCCCLYRLDVAIRCAQTTACLACLTNDSLDKEIII